MAKLHKDLKGKEFGFDDIILKCNLFPDFSRDDVDLKTNFSRNIKIKTPFSSAPMDTVTGSAMATLLALEGGIGVIHYNYPTVDMQIEEGLKTRNYKAAFVQKPIVLSPNHSAQDVYDIGEKYGFYSIPITENGTMNTRLIGIVTRRDIRYIEGENKRKRTKLGKIMTKELRTAHRKSTLDKNDIHEANRIIKKYNLDTLPIIDDDHKLVALVTDSDIKKNENYPLATKDENKQLKVLISIEGNWSGDRKKILDRIHKGADAGITGYVIDQGIITADQFRIANYIRDNFPQQEIIVGNLCSEKMLADAIKHFYKYFDAIKVGVGPGAACSTNERLSVGRLQGSAVYKCAEMAKALEKRYGKTYLIADGGIRTPGHVSLALALGADSVMTGYMLAPLQESLAPLVMVEVKDEKTGEIHYKTRKKYRGMGSLEAITEREGSAARYGLTELKVKVPEGIVRDLEPYWGTGHQFVEELAAGVRQSLWKQGLRNIKKLQDYAEIIPYKESRK